MRAIKLLTLISLMLAAPGAAIAQPREEPRSIAAEAGRPWTHKQTGMVLPGSAAGLNRVQLSDLTASELDVFAVYQDPASDMLALVFVYRAGIPDAAIWYDRAAWTMRRTVQHGLENAVIPPPTPFARPGAGAPSGLRLAMDVPGPGFKSTALAVAPLGDWMVKVRMSSRSLDKSALDSKLDAILAALRWPAESGKPRAAAPILPCPAPLKTKQARIAPDDMASVLMNAVAPTIKIEGPAPLYCREPGLPPELAVYRPNGDKDRYVVALNDAGVALSVAPSLAGLLSGDGGKKYSMTRLDHGSAAVLPSFTRLPPPQQAVSVALGSSAAVSVTPPSETPR